MAKLLLFIEVLSLAIFAMDINETSRLKNLIQINQALNSQIQSLHQIIDDSLFMRQNMEDQLKIQSFQIAELNNVIELTSMTLQTTKEEYVHRLNEMNTQLANERSLRIKLMEQVNQLNEQVHFLRRKMESDTIRYSQDNIRLLMPQMQQNSEQTITPQPPIIAQPIVAGPLSNTQSHLSMPQSPPNIPYAEPIPHAEAITVGSPQIMAENRRQYLPAGRRIDKNRTRTKLCRDWARGVRCPWGANCAFAHGAEQIRQ